MNDLDDDIPQYHKDFILNLIKLQIEKDKIVRVASVEKLIVDCVDPEKITFDFNNLNNVIYNFLEVNDIDPTIFTTNKASTLYINLALTKITSLFNASDADKVLDLLIIDKEFHSDNVIYEALKYKGFKNLLSNVNISLKISTSNRYMEYYENVWTAELRTKFINLDEAYDKLYERYAKIKGT